MFGLQALHPVLAHQILSLILFTQFEQLIHSSRYELVMQRFRFKWLVRCDDNNVVVMSRVLEQLDTVRDRDELRCDYA
jgi:hypothetical protein